jgi:general stress protein 26
VGQIGERTTWNETEDDRAEEMPWQAECKSWFELNQPTFKVVKTLVNIISVITFRNSK